MRAAAGLALLISLAAGPSAAGEVACRIENGALVAPAAFGDIAGDFLIDASAPTSTLHLTVAQADGITEASARRGLKLAGSRLAGVEMTVASLDAREMGFVTNITGVIGADVLRRLVVDIRFAPCRITVRRRAGRPAGALTIRWLGGTPAVAAAIADRGGTARAGLFSIDTAAAGSRIAGAGFSRPLPAGSDPASPTAPPARLRALSLAGRLMENTPAGLLTDPPPNLAGALGLAIWTRYDLRLDLADGWVALSPEAPRKR